MHTLPKVSIWSILQLVEISQELQRITNSSQSMNCEMGCMKHPWKSHGHSKQKPGKSPTFAPQLPALPTLLAMTQPCCTFNVKNSWGRSIPPNPCPLPGTPQQLLHPRVALRCNGENPGRLFWPAQVWVSSENQDPALADLHGSYTPALQKLQLFLRPPLCKCLRRHLRAQRNGQAPFISTKNLAGSGLTLCLWRRVVTLVRL